MKYFARREEPHTHTHTHTDVVIAKWYYAFEKDSQRESSKNVGRAAETLLASCSV